MNILRHPVFDAYANVSDIRVVAQAFKQDLANSADPDKTFFEFFTLQDVVATPTKKGQNIMLILKSKSDKDYKFILSPEQSRICNNTNLRNRIGKNITVAFYLDSTGQYVIPELDTSALTFV